MNDAPARTPGHHIDDGRNIVHGDTGRTGQDVFYAAVQMTRMPMCLADPALPDNPLVFVNRAFCEMTGYDEAEILGRNCRFLQGPDTDPETIATLRRAIGAREDVSVEILNYRRDGTAFWNALFLSPVFDDAGRLLYFFGSQIDITKKREAEVMLQQSQRMEALGSLAAGVAHEFNNLLTIVGGSIEQASANPSSERQAVQLARAAIGTERAGRLTQQILSFSRRQFHDQRNLDLNELVRATDSLIAQSAGEHHALTYALSPEPLPVRVDPGQLELALLNLVRNATDASPDGGTITIGTGTAGPAPHAHAALSVTDTGTGMPPEVQRRAAEPFFTTKPRGQGTGLGLSMVHGFAEQSGGRLAIESTPGAGTTVSILLPLLSLPP